MKDFNIGQYIGYNDETHIVQVEEGYGIDIMNNSKITLAEGSFFKPKKEYVSIMKIQSQSNTVENFSIYLCKKNEFQGQKIYSGLILPAQEKEIIFSFIPIENDCMNFLIVNEGNPNKNIAALSIGLYYGSNIISNLGKLKKIGIQANPNSVFLINGEVITIGQSGIYEFLNGLVEIYSVTPINIEGNMFILDYQY